jgi:hypothetical protein
MNRMIAIRTNGGSMHHAGCMNDLMRTATGHPKTPRCPQHPHHNNNNPDAEKTTMPKVILVLRSLR